MFLEPYNQLPVLYLLGLAPGQFWRNFCTDRIWRFFCYQTESGYPARWVWL